MLQPSISCFPVGLAALCVRVVLAFGLIRSSFQAFVVHDYDRVQVILQQKN